MNLHQPPTYAGYEDPQKPGFHHPAWVEYWAASRGQSETPALISLLASVFRRSRSSSSDANLLTMASMVLRRRPPQVVFSTWANRASYVATSYREGALLVITDQPALFVANGGAFVYKAGIWRGTLSNLPTLGTADQWLLTEITDYGHTLRWNGSAYIWGPNDDGSGYYRLCETAPTTAGWQICDGSTVARLNADGTTTNVTVPDVTTARYIKAALTAAAVAAAGGASGTPSATETVDNDLAASTVAVGSATHTHGIGTLDPANKQVILYYRR